MTLITRLSKLFQADMNAVLDKIEDPECLLKQALRDMEAALAQTEKQAQLAACDLKQKVNKQQELKLCIAELDTKMALCFAEGKDELARALTRRKLEIQQDLKNLSGSVGALEETLQRLTKQQQEQQSVLQEMKQKAEVFQADHPGSASVCAGSRNVIREEDIEAAFLYEKHKWSQS